MRISTNRYGDSFTSLYVDDIRTSQGAHIVANSILQRSLRFTVVIRSHLPAWDQTRLHFNYTVSLCLSLCLTRHFLYIFQLTIPCITYISHTITAFLKVYVLKI
jgi:hypothetical protein